MVTFQVVLPLPCESTDMTHCCSNVMFGPVIDTLSCTPCSSGGGTALASVMGASRPAAGDRPFAVLR